MPRSQSKARVGLDMKQELQQMFNRVQNCVGRRESKLPGLWAEFLVLDSFYSELPGDQSLDGIRVGSAVLGCREEEAQCPSFP